MDGKAKITGLDDALKVLEQAYPQDPKTQGQVVGAAIGSAARKTILPLAKQRAKQPDSSGALAESLAIRSTPASVLRSKRKAAGRKILPVRNNTVAIAKYIQHYYTNRGKAIPMGGISGIRHGHLVEFGFRHKSGKHVAARPFLWNSAQDGRSAYLSIFADEMKTIIKRRVARAKAKRRKK